MNHRLQTMFQQLELLDTYTQSSVLGSWGYTVNSGCLSAAKRYIPDGPVDNGIEEFTQYEAARRAMLRDAEESQLPVLLALQREIASMQENANARISTLQSTFEFLTSNPPTRKQIEAQYEERRRLGMKPAIPMKTFVDMEHEGAMKRFNDMIAKGEDAVRLCETVSIENVTMDDVPEWLPDAFETKLVDKLHKRWEKLEMDRTNPRRPKRDRDAAQADQMLIASVLSEYGETPGFGEEAEAKAKDDAFIDSPLDDIAPSTPTTAQPRTHASGRVTSI